MMTIKSVPTTPNKTGSITCAFIILSNPVFIVTRFLMVTALPFDDLYSFKPAGKNIENYWVSSEPI